MSDYDNVEQYDLYETQIQILKEEIEKLRKENAKLREFMNDIIYYTHRKLEEENND